MDCMTKSSGASGAASASEASLTSRNRLPSRPGRAGLTSMIAFMGERARKFYAASGLAAPDPQLVVGGHGVIRYQLEALFQRETVHFIRIAQAAVGIAVLQERIEFRVALARVTLAVA